MKKVLVFVLAMMMLIAMAACGQSTPQATATPDETVDATAAAYEWSVTIGDTVLDSETIAGACECTTQTLQKVSKDGSMKDQECKGYKVCDLLAQAGIGEFTTLTVVAADGYEYELDSETALLDTTMLVIEQDGEAYETPRFAVEGGGSAAWVKDVVELKITE